MLNKLKDILNTYTDEELKKINPKFVAMRDFKILTVDGCVMKKWTRK